MAAAPHARAPGGAITGINVTPLVDITLVLLIVFMVTAKLIVRRQGLAVDLPKAASGETVQEIFGVVLGPDGSVEVDSRKVRDDDAILPLARDALRSHADLRAVIQADGGQPHRRVMHVLDLLRQAGVARIAFGVVPAPLPSAAPAEAPSP